MIAPRMTSIRKRKKQASQLQLNVPQLELVELVHELIEAHRWLQILGFANQFALAERLNLPVADRDRILEAATRAVDKDARLQGWRQRLTRVRAQLDQATRNMHAEGAADQRTAHADATS